MDNCGTKMDHWTFGRNHGWESQREWRIEFANARIGDFHVTLGAGVSWQHNVTTDVHELFIAHWSMQRIRNHRWSHFSLTTTCTLTIARTLWPLVVDSPSWSFVVAFLFSLFVVLKTLCTDSVHTFIKQSQIVYILQQSATGVSTAHFTRHIFSLIYNTKCHIDMGSSLACSAHFTPRHPYAENVCCLIFSDFPSGHFFFAFWNLRAEMVESEEFESEIFVLFQRNSNARFWSTRCEDWFNTEQNHPQYNSKTSTKAQKEYRFFHGKQIAFLIYEYFRVIGANDSVENNADLFTIGLRNDDIKEFDSKWDEIKLSMTKIPQDDILEGLYKSRTRESENFEKKRRGQESGDRTACTKNSWRLLAMGSQRAVCEKRIEVSATTSISVGKVTQSITSPTSFMQLNFFMQ